MPWTGVTAVVDLDVLERCVKLREELALARCIGRPFDRQDIEGVLADLEDFFDRYSRMQAMARSLGNEYQALLRVLFAQPAQDIVDARDVAGAEAAGDIPPTPHRGGPE